MIFSFGVVLGVASPLQLLVMTVTHDHNHDSTSWWLVMIQHHENKFVFIFHISPPYYNCRLLFIIIIIPGVGDHPLCDQREDRPWLRWCRGRWRHHLRSHLWSVFWTHCGKVSSWWSPWLSSLSISESISYHGHHHHHGNHHGYNHHHGNHHGHLCRVLARPDIAKSTLEGTTATSDLFSMVRLYMNGDDDGVSA